MTDFVGSLTGPNRPVTTTDLVALAEDIVSNSSGLTGMALKGGLAAARKIDADIVTKIINRILPDVARALEPHWTAFEAAGDPNADFGTYLDAHADEVTPDLLKVADSNAEGATSPALQKIYKGIRVNAESQVKDHLTQIGTVLQEHVS